MLLPDSVSARAMAVAALFPIGPMLITARSLPSFNFRPLPTGISSSGHFQSTNTPRPLG